MHKRRLNEIEYINWTLGQPYNISMSTTVRGNLHEGILRSALDKIQQKHPLLQAQLLIDANEKPYLIWGKVGKIPMEIIPRTGEEQYEKIIENEFITPFETGNNCPLPLIRVKVLLSDTVFDLIITMQHIIADGMSMVFLFKDIIDFMTKPGKKVKSQEVVKIIEDVLPPYYRKTIPKTPKKFNRAIWFMKRIVKIYRLKDRLKKGSPTQKTLIFKDFKTKKFKTLAWILNEDQSQTLIRKCKENNVTIHSALCTLFLSDFPVINNPVNLRKRLAYNVGQSVGCFAGGLVIKKKYKKRQDFWENARNYHKKLTKGLKDENLFKIFKMISRAVPLISLQESASIYLELVSKSQPFGVTNLGSLDRFNILLRSNEFTVEHIYGGVSSGVLNALILAIFTIKNRIHFHFHYYKPPHTGEEIEKYVSNAMKKLDNALKS
ncbi:MAG: condensation domain-containing protein [Candidatus Hodarchaeota archaeon]